jgi:hypothetical protein
MAQIAIVPFSACPSAVRRQLDASAMAEGSYGWFLSLAETTLEPGEEAVLAVAQDEGDAPRAVLPLVRMSSGGLRALTAPYTTLYAPALPDPVWSRILGTAARQYVSGYLRLDALDPSDPGIAALAEGLASSGLLTASYRHFANWFEPVTDFDSYWGSRPSRLRTTVRRKLALTQKSASAGFHCYREGAELEQALAVYDDVYRSSWKSPEPHPLFMPRMVRALAQEGSARIGIMLLAGTPVAAQIWLVRAHRATIFKLGHREDAAAHSPGTLLTHWMASTLIAGDALKEIDFGRGDDAYKREWLTNVRYRTGLVAGDWKNRIGLKIIAHEVLPTKLAAIRRRVVAKVLRIVRHGRLAESSPGEPSA